MKIKAKTENDTEFTNNFFSSCVHSWKCPSLSSWVLVLCPWVQFSVPTESVPSGCGPRCHHTSICYLSDRCSGHLQKPLDELWCVQAVAWLFFALSLFCFWAGHQLVPHIPCPAGGCAWSRQGQCCPLMSTLGKEPCTKGFVHHPLHPSKAISDRGPMAVSYRFLWVMVGEGCLGLGE